jgi:hypothetical protein
MSQVCDLRERRLDEEELISEFTKTIEVWNCPMISA